ncbi:hypothetical protein ACQ4M3_07915 [Leptolyngbya sp. AN03gr2]|uniref:hypothetical protein n=1 Tax=unclassified Leptolyngbya TaxID=2650499 RepID=UPI003D31C4C1
MPKLALAIEFEEVEGRKLQPEAVRPPFNETRTWHPILHQTAGNGCQNHYLWASLLEPHPEYVPGLTRLSRCYEGSLIGWKITGSPSLDQLLEYRETIRLLIHPECNCNTSYRHLEEGYYPFDLSSLSLLTAEALPHFRHLNQLLQPEPEGLGLIEGSRWNPHWNLLLLGENSD